MCPEVNQSHEGYVEVFINVFRTAGYGQHSLTEMIQGLGFQERKDLKVLCLLV